ncbi:interferon-induced protein with tetratricopeptide repeats 5-like isoform X6 [Pristis pectinata]|uniref:interferon-induced protein with tetratricopeptide repeats 5-like isoform X1 n=1 Tax=Pristis pectinata TaxID=685728 RepID=UPI00223CF1F2|nr:interferon-induced protein with tetratricopeptide repeats 5-like isoform X1 [Pristis pectinata]XP_051883246.1 interferon-induced protein with tetratricopeptide repeats 5-like isoform X2 [Pristis pectinata]XP_051883247.1 interferon-induced protein with tetratricopeptide repeats 5-like isoform X3 [Pristis pectinata]XP_051883248.1 interferon-induced protein with tetratricopeptide repeats 5-like isoform X3 [Pristis pectinata]XP_051883249.1 interferon-induced protein with tetratricopeptide repeat
MSNAPRDLLKEKLDQLQCHFTWGPQKETIDLDDMMYRLQDAMDLGVKYQAECHNQLAFVNCLQGNCEEAIQNLKEAEEILKENHKDEFQRKSIITYGNFAWVHYHMGQLAEAQSYLDKLEMICKPLTDGPRYTAMIPEVYGEKGWSLIRSSVQYYEEAKECFAKALEEDPDNTEWIMGYATVLFRLESFSGTPESRERSQSVKHLRRVLELDPGDSVAMVLLALKLQEFKQKKEANKLVEQALHKTPDFPYVLRYAAKFCRLEGDVEKAVGLLKRALKITPLSAFLHDQIAMCYKIRLDELIGNPRSRNPRNAAFKQKTELFNQCKYHLGKAFEHRPRSAIKSQLDFAGICVKNGEYSKAKEIYSNLEKLDDIRPENIQRICLQAGSFELHQRRSESDAIRLFLKGLKVEYESNERKWCHEKLKRWADRKLCRNPCDSKALGVKGFLYQLDGNKAKAIEYFEKALEFDSGNEEYLNALCELSLSIQEHNDA